jgi:predicted transcriptional regulator
MPEFAARRRASTTVSKMMLICCRNLVRAYRPGNIATVFPELLVSMAVRVNDQRRGNKPISIIAIARITGMPRANVQRFLKHLVRHGVVEKRDGGYVSCDDYLRQRLGARYFVHIIRAIRATEKDLRGYQPTLLIVSTPKLGVLKLIMLILSSC